MPGPVQPDHRFPVEDGERPAQLQHDLRRVLVVATWVLAGFVVLAQLPWVVAAFADGPGAGWWWLSSIVPRVSVLLAVPVATLLGLAWVGAGSGRPGSAAAREPSTCASTLASVALLVLVLEILLVGTVVAMTWAG
ncbi:hypothetical protein BKA08_003448 [Nocardioides marinisabuli]|uniref:Uncharacterized protein n=1 Tax=Nocardioides marinisabuli TaxID=419476 RepID=A0A7Y9F5X7_9ACTN|nr:hypothetical protein [Nocardioides marinisabuli]NYD59210.1 hypothetical protein [Nocardioides marinisabuli]